jgi:GrpB-like predicted nucleotidyltransferase (UPF0157 family)
MSDITSLNDPIEIVPYDPIWTESAEKEINRLKSIFPFSWIIDIEHIGSTAVPGLSAKPIIDIYIGVTSIHEAQKAIEPIKKLGYQFWEDNPNTEKMFFVKGMPPFGEKRTHHIHIVEHNGNYWRTRILFRDYLRSHTNEARKYAKLKLKLMKEYVLDREAYTDAKSEFVNSVLAKAGFKEKVKR